MTRPLLGIHHVTSMTDDIERNYHFMTEILGMRLVKKTINQDDIHTYHTFFADDVGTPGTDATYFDFPQTIQGQAGTNSISRIGLRVPDDAALLYYRDRLDEFGVEHGEIEELFGRKVLNFQEADGQAYRLFSDEEDEGVRPGQPWKEGPVSEDQAIYGLGPIEITVSYYEDFLSVMTGLYGFRIGQQTADAAFLEIGEGGNGGAMILRRDTESPQARPGDGEVHHVAFRVKDVEDLEDWLELYTERGLMNSGLVERYYFKALYARLGHILIELSTDGPGFMEDEPYETLGESLSLPDFLEADRQEIEAAIKPFDTRRS